MKLAEIQRAPDVAESALRLPETRFQAPVGPRFDGIEFDLTAIDKIHEALLLPAIPAQQAGHREIDRHHATGP